MTNTGASSVPDPDERATLTTALLTTGVDSGFYDDHGRTSPWPDDIDEWGAATSELITTNPTNNPSNQHQLERSTDTPRPGT